MVHSAKIKTTPSRWICADTSTFIESLALVEDHLLLCELNIKRAKGHASGLHEDLDRMLRSVGWSLDSLSGFICGLGPGSFTGMRVGLSALKGLAYASHLPLYGIPSTYALLNATASKKSLALVDARRGELHAQGIGIEQGKTLTVEQLFTILDEQGLTPEVCIGEGALRYHTQLTAHWPNTQISKNEAAHLPRAALLYNAIESATPVDISSIEPIYVRASDAELNYPDGFPSEARYFAQKAKAK